MGNPSTFNIYRDSLKHTSKQLHEKLIASLPDMNLDEIIKKKMALCVFDFSGSGMSEGEYISLGYHELNDVESVISYLK